MTLLKGLRVVEMGIWVAGPAAGGILADWGADVVKIEPLSGDPMRRLYQALSGSREERCPPFDHYNRGKRSVALDLKTEAGQDLADRLLGQADVFLTNLRPQYLRRVGLGAEEVQARFPRLVYAILTGYGLEGPDRDAPGFDVAAFSARSGVAERSTPPGASPPILPGGLGDNVTALSLVGGILGALWNRERTGEGRLVSTSLLRTGLYSIGMDVSARLALGRNAPAQSRKKPQNPLMNPYEAGDGRWFWLIGAEAERHWPGIVAATGDDALLADERFATPRLRRRNAEALVARFDEIFATQPRDEWAAIFARKDVWWAPVNGMEDLQEDPQVRASGAFVAVPGDDAEGLATPVDFGAAGTGPAGAVPAVGEHSAEILSEIGVAAETLGELRRAGVVG